MFDIQYRLHRHSFVKLLHTPWPEQSRKQSEKFNQISVILQNSRRNSHSFIKKLRNSSIINLILTGLIGIEHNIYSIIISNISNINLIIKFILSSI